MCVSMTQKGPTSPSGRPPIEGQKIGAENKQISLYLASRIFKGNRAVDMRVTHLTHSEEFSENRKRHRNDYVNLDWLLCVYVFECVCVCMGDSYFSMRLLYLSSCRSPWRLNVRCMFARVSVYVFG